MNDVKKLVYTALLSSLLTASVCIFYVDKHKAQSSQAGPRSIAVNIGEANCENQQLDIQRLTSRLATEEEQILRLENELQLLQGLVSGSQLEAEKAAGAELWFDEQRLQALGVASYEIADIQQLANKAALEKLQLHNDANRGDARMSATARRAIRAVEQNLKQQLGDDNYDRLLYATRVMNRVEVTDTLPGSAADQAGLQKGDLILSYADQRIFNPKSLYDSTSKGEQGEMIRVSLERNHEIIDVYVPRGALGTRIKAAFGTPATQ